MGTLADRVDTILEQRNMNRSQLADAVGLSKDKLSKSMSGARQFTVSEIAAIGERLDLDLFWLIHGRVDPLGTKVAFRHVYDEAEGEHQPPAAEERADLELVQRAYSLASAPADERFEAFRAQVDAVDNPSWAELRSCAAATREHWTAWLREHPVTLDLEGFLAKIGIDLIILPGPMGQRAQTYSLELRGRKVIVAHTTRAWYSAVFGVFHELGHLLFGHLQWRTGEQPTWTIRPEPAANGFAADLLLPAKSVWALTSDQSPDSLAELCWNHQIGAGTLANRCRQLNKDIECPAQKQITALWRESYGSDADARAAEWQAARFPAWLIELHEERVAQGSIPADTLSEMTDTPVEDLAPPRVPEIPEDVAQAMAELGL